MDGEQGLACPGTSLGRMVPWSAFRCSVRELRFQVRADGELAQYKGTNHVEAWSGALTPTPNTLWVLNSGSRVSEGWRQAGVTLEFFGLK